MRAFVTVGSTQFDDLINAALSPAVLKALSEKGYTHIEVQCGNYSGLSALGDSNENGPWQITREGIVVVVWRYKPALNDDFAIADLVIGHAGSGTMLEVLRLKKPMICVPNPSLLDNHQVELASELDKFGYLKASTTQSLAADIKSFVSGDLKPFPPMDESRFRDLLDETMGFI